MKILCEVTQEKEGELKEGEPQEERSDWWLLYWGLEYKMIDVGDRIVPVNYSVAICQHYDTGQVETFLPSQLKILGKTLPKE